MNGYETAGPAGDSFSFFDSLCAEERSSSAAAGIRTKQFLSPIYTIDRKYRSEEGPWSNQKLTLWESTPPELLWITGIRTEMVGSDGATPTFPNSCATSA